MSTPEDKVMAAATKVGDQLAADAAKVKSLWQRWEVYIVAVVSLVAGFVVGKL